MLPKSDLFLPFFFCFEVKWFNRVVSKVPFLCLYFENPFLLVTSRRPCWSLPLFSLLRFFTFVTKWRQFENKRKLLMVLNISCFRTHMDQVIFLRASVLREHFVPLCFLQKFVNSIFLTLTCFIFEIWESLSCFVGKL